MASNEGSKPKGRKAAVAAVNPAAVIAATRKSTRSAAKPKPKPKPKPQPASKPKPPKRRARRQSPRPSRSRAKPKPKPKPKPERPAATVAARRVASAGGNRVTVDARARKRAERLVAEIRDRKRRVARDFYTMGEALAALSRPPMFGALGHETFETMLAEQELVSASTAYKLMAVVEAYPREQALELGLEKAYGLVRWSKTTGSDRSPSELAASNALIGNRRVRELTVRALQDQLRRARESAPGPGRGGGRRDGRTEARKHAERVARHMQREMRAQGLDGAKARARRVGGQWHVTIDVLASEAEAWLR